MQQTSESAEALQIPDRDTGPGSAGEGPPARKALVLFSGGLDSTTVLAWARREGFRPEALIFDYGQRHGVEVDRAAETARRLGVRYHVQRIDLEGIGGSSLTDRSLEVAKGRGDDEIAAGGIPTTYVPARNTVFLSLALARADADAIDEICLGVNALDYSGYPDCRPEYLEAFERMANLALRRPVEEGARIRIHAPLIDKTKAQIVAMGAELGVDWSLTWSCYDPVPGGPRGVHPCGRCDSCHLRAKGFREAGFEDPLVG